MVKRNVKMIVALAIAVTLSTGGTITQAVTLSSNSLPSQTQNVEKKHNNTLYSVLEGKLGYTKEQIDDAAKAGKTAFDLAKQKGVTDDQLKTMLIDAQSKKIDQKVSEGKLTQEKANAIKTNSKTRIQQWNGSLKQKNSNKHYSKSAYQVLKDKLGFTDAQIKDAANSGKTAFDLVATKGVTADQLKSMIVDYQSQKIDQKVSEGKITPDKAKTIKANLISSIQKWDGNLNYKNKRDKSN
jgi:hypothetical protein